MIYASVDGTNFEAIDSVNADQTSYPVTGLTPGTAWTFYVTSADADGLESSASTAAAATTDVMPPTDLSATVSHSDEVDLAWADPSFGTAQTLILASTDGTTFNAIAEVAAGTTTFAASNLDPDQTYTFMVTADYGANGTSAGTDQIVATAISSELQASGTGSVDEGDQYTLALSSTPADALSSAIVSWQVDWHDGISGGTNGASDIHTYTGESPSATHTFANGSSGGIVTVTAIDNDGNHFVLPTTDVWVAPTAPSGVTTSVFGRDRIDVTWTDNSEVEDGYTILRSDDGGETFNEVGSADADATSFSDNGLTPDTPYEYEVKANGAADGATDSGDGSGDGSGGGSDGGGSSTSPSTDPATTDTGHLVPSALAQVSGNVNGGTVKVDWTYTGQDDSGFELEMEDQTAGENFHLIDTAGALLSDAHDTSLVVVAADHTYGFRIRVDYTDGTVSDYMDLGTFSLTLSGAPSLHAEAHVDYDDAADHHIAEGWSAHLTFGPPSGKTASDLAGYKLEYHYDDTPGPGWLVYNPPDLIDPTLTSLDIRFAVPSTAHDYFRLAAIYADGSGSAWQSDGETQGGPASSNPTLHGTVVSDTEIDLSGTEIPGWTYHLYEGTQTDGMGTKTTIWTDSLEPTDPGGPWSADATGLTPGTHYYFALEAEPPDEPRAEGLGLWDGSTTGASTTVPAAPTFVHAVRDIRRKKIILSWPNSSSNETGFQIYRADSIGDLYLLTTVDADKTTYEEESPSLTNWPLTYKIVAINAANATTANSESAGPEIQLESIGGPEIKDELMHVAATLDEKWRNLGPAQKDQLARDSVNLFKGENLWDMEGFRDRSFGAENWMGKGIGTVTVNGLVFDQQAVNYWLGGLICGKLDEISDAAHSYGASYRALARAAIYVRASPDRNTWSQESCNAEKLDWFNAGIARDYNLPVPPTWLQGIDPGTKTNKPIRWHWGDIAGGIELDNNNEP